MVAKESAQGNGTAAGFADAARAAWPGVDVERMRLCYVDSGTAHFTALPLDKQWGDDWNDAPYEYNAGSPYSDGPGQIVRVRFTGWLDTPAERHEAEGGCNSPWSVEEINAKQTPWLATTLGAKGPTGGYVEIWSGTNPVEFARLVLSVGGSATPLAMEAGDE